MSSKPRVIAATASAALLAGAGAAGAVVAVDILTTDQTAVADGASSDSPSLKSAQDDSTTVYRDPGTDSTGSLKPAPKDTSYKSGSSGGSKSSKSHSS